MYFLLLFTTTVLISTVDGGIRETWRRRILCRATVRLPRHTTVNPLRRVSQMFHPYFLKTQMLTCRNLSFVCSAESITSQGDHLHPQEEYSFLTGR